jgi:hypothetical protein
MRPDAREGGIKVGVHSVVDDHHSVFRKKE